MRWWWCIVMLAPVGCDRVFQLDEVDGPSFPEGDGGVAQDAVRQRPDGEPANCPADYDLVLPTTASRYKLVLSSEDWPTAAADCANNSVGARTHLIVLSVPEEWTALKTMADTVLTNVTWVGMTDRSTEGTFQWITSEPTDYAVTGMQLPWELDQPNGNGNCAQMRAVSGALHDEDCTNSGNYICECDDFANVPDRY